MTVTPEEYLELESDAPNWMARHLSIIPKAGGVVPFELNVAQMKLLSVINYLRSVGRPVRILVLKARQHGITTFGLGYFYYRANLKAQHRAVMAAHKFDAAVNLFNKVDMFQTRNPEPLATRVDQVRALAFAHPHGSSISVDTAGDTDLGRSGTMQDFHGSEVAFWKFAKASMTSVMQCVPRLPDTTVILETTANGVGGEFYDRWCGACRIYEDKSMLLPQGTWDSSEFVAVFLPWHMSPEYSSEVPVGFSRTDEEGKLAESLGLDDGQLAWRRKAIRDLCGGDIDMFHQEYPSTDQEAFLVSGRPVFNAESLRVLGDRVRPAERGVGYFDSDGVWGETSDPSRQWVEIDEVPLAGVSYVLGADSAEGLDPNESSDPDSHSATVLRLPEMKMVAKVSSRGLDGKNRGGFDADQFAEQIAWLGGWYNEALLGFELNNSSGGSVRSTLKRLDYPNMYWRESYDEIADRATRKIGWYTDKLTRGMLVADLGEFIRRMRLGVYSAQTVRQLQTFVYDKAGKPQHAPGEHDDDVFSLGLALQMAIYQAENGGVSLVGDSSGQVAGPVAVDHGPACLIGGCEPDPMLEYDDLVTLDEDVEWI